MPNLFAYFMLWIWPIAIFLLIKRYPVNHAILMAFVLSVLFLPVITVDPPLLPPLNKDSITSLSLFTFLLFSGKRIGIFQRSMVSKFLWLFFLASMVSNELNDFPITVGDKVIPALKPYDTFSTFVRYSLEFMPFFLGRRFLNNFIDNEFIFRYMARIGLFYSVLMLFEIRMSPQLHNWIYGFLPTEFIQQIRAGGFRPIVFVGHGLPMAFIFFTFLTGAFSLFKNRVRFTQYSSAFVIGYMVLVLFLCKTWSAILYACIGGVLINLFIPRVQVKIAMYMVFLVLLFPISRILDIFPTTGTVDLIKEFSSERAHSVDFRFKNEDVLLNRAMERPWFGWSGWGRNRVFNENGKDLSVTDGKWILIFGINGLVGFIAYYGILILPIYYANKVIRRVKEPRYQVYIAAQVLILAVCLIDSIPNTNMGALHLLLAGSLIGQCEKFMRQKTVRNNQILIKK